MCAPRAFSRLSQPTAMSICSAVHSRNNMRPFGRRTPTSKLWQAIAASWRMTVLRVIRLLLIWQLSAPPPRREKSDLSGAFGAARSDVGCSFSASIGADLGRGADAAWPAAAAHRSRELGVHNPRSPAWIALPAVVRRSSCRFGWIFGWVWWREVLVGSQARFEASIVPPKRANGAVEV